MPEVLTLSSMADAEPDLSTFENKTGLAEDMKFLASMPELCDVTFLVGDTREPVCAVKVGYIYIKIKNQSIKWGFIPVSLPYTLAARLVLCLRHHADRALPVTKTHIPNVCVFCRCFVAFCFEHE